jgi:HKD family nuclease
MQNRIVVQGRTKGDSPLTQVIAGAVAGGNLDRLDVAVAYATLSGLDELEKALGGFAPTSRWLIGLDDAVSQPAALDRILATPGATLKVASFSKQGRRYHPKVYRLWSSADVAVGVMAVGSGNLTRHGLIENGEAGVFLSAESAADAQSLEHSWDRIWAMGNLPTPKDLTDYKLRYDAARKARARLLKAGVVPLDPVIDEIDDEPALPVKTSAALTGWLDIGSATAQGREVEIPKLMWPFLGTARTANCALDCLMARLCRSP